MTVESNREKEMRFTATDFFTYLRPQKCERRVYLLENRIPAAPPGPFEELIKRLGLKHETRHLSSFNSYVDLSEIPEEERVKRTIEEVNKSTPVIYQSMLKASTDIGGVECEIVGEPDFLIGESGHYIIRDSKISRRITEGDHPEILLQLQIYGWLYEQSFDQAPIALQVHNGLDEIVEIPYDGGHSAIGFLQEILEYKRMPVEPFSPVGWSKCGSCGYRDRCWAQAEEERNVAIVEGVDQGLAIALHRDGIQTVDEFLDAFDVGSLSDYKRPWGKRTRRVGKEAGSILQMARSLAEKREILLERPDIPDHPNYVMFDLEGLPPHVEQLEKIYLWGMQVFGDDSGEFIAATASFGESGDSEGWEEFLQKAEGILDRYGDLPFVHWHSYEKTFLDKYVKRFGDPDGTAARVRHNLLDLLPITKKSIALPVPSYSLKVIEKYVGFQRSQDEYGGDWSIAKYIEATETEDEKMRTKVLEQILLYNKEDLEATWAVFQWLRSRVP